MKTMKSFAVQIATVLFMLGTALTALADPPSRVARLQYISGDVSIQPGGVKDWVAGVVNRPLTTADRVWTDKDSRAELHLGNLFMRMNAETSLTLTNLSDETVQVELDQGTLNLKIRHMYNGEIYEVDTPNLAFTLTKAGEYRLDVDPNGDTTLATVWKGEGEATGEGRAVQVRKGEQARFTGGTSLEHQLMDAPDFDGFDDWCRVRDRREDHSQSGRYVSPDVIGAEDLDDYGTWRVVPAYGPVWVPVVAPGWAPYRFGHWVWVEPWGWTWVDDAPWGFAPCHYGRWVYYSGYWGWVPGPVAVRPVYAPALVAWVGGSHWGISMSFGGGGGVAWFPLGYGEPYIPPYQVSRSYFQNVNVSNTHITNITNVTNNYYITNNNITTNNTTNITNIVYKNQTVPGAVTAVPKTVLMNAQPVAKAAVQVPTKEIAGVPPVVAPPVAPLKTSVLGAGGPGSLPPAHAVVRPVVAKVTRPPLPLPFTAKQQALAANPGRPLDTATEQQLRSHLPHEPTQEPFATHPAPREVEIANPHPNQGHAIPQPPAKNATVERPLPNVPLHQVPRPPQTRNAEEMPAVETARPPVPHPPNRTVQPTPMETEQHPAARPAVDPVTRERDNPPSQSGPQQRRADSEPSPSRGANADGQRPFSTDHPVPRPPSTQRPEAGEYGHDAQRNPQPEHEAVKPHPAPPSESKPAEKARAEEEHKTKPER